MHKYPTCLTCGLQTGKDRIGTLVAAIHYGNLRMRGEWKLGKAAVAWADSDNDSRHPGMSQQRINRVFKNGFIANREVLLRTLCLHSAAKPGSRHHGANVQ